MHKQQECNFNDEINLFNQCIPNAKSVELLKQDTGFATRFSV